MHPDETRWRTTVSTADLPPDLAEWRWPAAAANTPAAAAKTDDPHCRVVIAGGGLAGLEVARHLAAITVDGGYAAADTHAKRAHDAH
jgi:NADPH-dependent 2,4-dienoyl-CoA reductase/sulfur reductase-like enzyme